MHILIDGCAFENLYQVGVQRYFREMLALVARSEQVTIFTSRRPEAKLPEHCRIISASDLSSANIARFDLFQSTRFTSSPLAGLPEVLQIHDMIPERHWKYSGQNADVSAKRQAAARATVITCVSQATANDVRSEYPEWSDKVRVVYPGTDHLEAERPRSEKPMRVSRRPWRQWLLNRRALSAARELMDRSYALFVGDRAEYKNFSVILDAMTESRWDSELLLAVVGKPFTPSELADIHRRNLESRIKNLGRVSDSRLGELYHSAVCFVFPSRAEGFGFPLLEAPLAGCPVICSDIPVFREIAGPFARFCPPEDFASWATSISAAQNSRMSPVEQQLARTHALQFRWERCAAEIVNVYREALNA